DFYGCNFINASAEFAEPRHPVRKLVMAHKQALLSWVMHQLACTLTQATGFCLLLEGAIVMAHSYQQPLALEQARTLAKSIWPTVAR
ncbi:MAG: TetR/AcrR family transcriptional regulator, partial [Aeromonas sobria]